MTDYIVAGADLTAVANEIRSKGGTSAQLEFPSEFISAIEAISGGGGGGSTNILSGTAEPTSADGSDGDVYLFYVDGEPFDLSTFAQRVNTSMLVTKTPTTAMFSWSSGDMVGAQVYKQVDLTDIDSISVDVSVGSSHYDISQTWLSPCVFIENTWNPASTWLGTSVNPNWSTQTPDSNAHAVIDTTGYTGTYYVVLTAYGCNATFSNLAFDDGSGMDEIIADYLKVNGSWQPLIGSDIDDVDTGGNQ